MFFIRFVIARLTANKKEDARRAFHEAGHAMVALPFSTLANTVKRINKKYPKALITIGDHLRKARLDRKLSQNALANQIDVPQVCIDFWERNVRYPAMVNLKKIIDFLGYYPFSEAITLPEKLIQYRRLHGLTQRELAAILNVCDTAVKAWEDGRNNPKPDTKMLLENILNQKELST